MHINIRENKLIKSNLAEVYEAPNHKMGRTHNVDVVERVSKSDAPPLNAQLLLNRIQCRRGICMLMAQIVTDVDGASLLLIDGVSYRIPQYLDSQELLDAEGIVSQDLLAWVVSELALVVGTRDFKTETYRQLRRGCLPSDSDLNGSAFLVPAILALQAGASLEFLAASEPLRNPDSTQLRLPIRSADDSDSFFTHQGVFKRMCFWAAGYHTLDGSASDYGIMNLTRLFDKSQRIFSEAEYEYIRDHHQILDVVYPESIRRRIQEMDLDPYEGISLLSFDSHSDIFRFNRNSIYDGSVTIGNWVERALREWPNLTKFRWVLHPETVMSSIGGQPGPFYEVQPNYILVKNYSAKDPHLRTLQFITQEDAMRIGKGVNGVDTENHWVVHYAKATYDFEEAAQDSSYSLLGHYYSGSEINLNYLSGKYTSNSLTNNLPIDLRDLVGPSIVTTDLDFFSCNTPSKKFNGEDFEGYLDALERSKARPMFHVVCESPLYIETDNPIAQKGVRFINSMLSMFGCSPDLVNDTLMANYYYRADRFDKGFEIHAGTNIERRSPVSRLAWLIRIAGQISPKYRDTFDLYSSEGLALKGLVENFVGEDLSGAFAEIGVETEEGGMAIHLEDYEDKIQKEAIRPRKHHGAVYSVQDKRETNTG